MKDQHKDVIYECPITPLVSHALSFERFYTNFNALLDTEGAPHFEAIFENIVKLIALVDKPEIKSKYVQFYLKLEQTLQRFHQNQAIDAAILDDLLSSVGRQLNNLNQHASKFSYPLLKENFIKELYTQHQNKATIEKQLGFITQSWLNQPLNAQLNDAHRWFNNLNAFADIVFKMLAIIRQFGSFTEYEASSGFLQIPFESQNAHLVRVAIAFDKPYYPLLNVGHHGLSLQLLKKEYLNPSEKLNLNAPFKLAICRL